MKKNQLFLVALLIAANAYSQNYPSLDKVGELVSDSSESTYYPNLLERFNRFDPELTMDDFILIYYGYGFQDSYNGYRDDPTHLYYSLYEEKEFEKILSLCDSVLEVTPVCIPSNLYKGKVLGELYPDSVIYRKYMERSFTLMDVLFASGDGKSIETAYKVLFLSDEKRIMYGALDLEGYSMQVLMDHYDELTVKKSKKYKKKRIYFDVYLPLIGTLREFRKENK